jgi:hypothetical protein
MAKGTAFTLENLKLLDFGRITAAFQQETKRVVADCMDRPGDEHARTVVLKFNFVPRADDGSLDCDTVAVDCEIFSAVPKRRTKVYEMRPKQSGDLAFNPDLPLEPDGETLYDKQEKDEDDK